MLPRLLGNKAEDQTCRWLQRQGLRLLHRNWQCRLGEIDLIMEHADTLVFIEVRQRQRQDYGGAAASVTPAKQRRLVATAKLFLASHPALAQQPCRFDVVALSGAGDNSDMQWIQNAFYGE